MQYTNHLARPVFDLHSIPTVSLDAYLPRQLRSLTHLHLEQDSCCKVQTSVGCVLGRIRARSGYCPPAASASRIGNSGPGRIVGCIWPIKNHQATTILNVECIGGWTAPFSSRLFLCFGDFTSIIQKIENFGVLHYRLHNGHAVVRQRSRSIVTKRYSTETRNSSWQTQD